MTTTQSSKPWHPDDAGPAAHADGHGEYARLDLIGLMSRIVEGDRVALHTLVQDRKPVYWHGLPVSLPGWIEAVSQGEATRRSVGEEAADLARDMLYDRLTRLPDAATPRDVNRPCQLDTAAGTGAELAQVVPPAGRRVGIDCRHYYRGFLNQLPQSISPAAPEGTAVGIPQFRDNHAASTRLVNNAWVHRRFSGFVHHNWKLCMREGWRRQQRVTVAFDYVAPGGTARIRVPAWISPRERKAWLERNFGPFEVSPDNTLELQHRIQTQIDQWIDHALRERERGLRQELQHDLFGMGQHAPGLENAWTNHGLGRAVALEKSNAPHRLRTSIAALGRERIQALILSIFEDMASGTYHPATTARRFGLHKSTLTRFAASRWNPGVDGPVPDLWLNTAQMLASQPRFVAALEQAGLDHLVDQLANPDR